MNSPPPFAMTQPWKGAAFTVHKSLGLFKRKAPLVWDAGPSQREGYTADRKEKSKGNKSRGRRIYEMWAGTGRPASSFGDQYVKNRTSCRQQRDPSSSSCNITWKPAVYRHWTADRPAHRQRKSIAQKRGEVWVDRKSGDCHVTYKTGGLASCCVLLLLHTAYIRFAVPCSSAFLLSWKMMMMKRKKDTSGFFLW
jgi:hypothetical protein